MSFTQRFLGDIVTLRRGYDLPTSSRVPGEFPVLSAGHAVGSHNEAKVTGPGFAVGRATNLGRPVWSNSDFWPLNTTLYAEDFKGNNPKWLYYLFENMDLSGFDSGSVQPMLNRNYIAKVPVKVPSLTEQEAVVEVLGALDDKIAANQTLMRLLSEISRAHVAKSTPGGEIVSTKDVTVSISRGVAPKYTSSGFTVLNQKCVRDGQISLGPSRMASTLPKKSEKVLQKEDILVNSTGQGTLGRVGRWTRSDTNVFVDSHVSVVRIDPERADPSFIGVFLLGCESHIESLAEGSTGQTELSREALSAIPLRLPSLSKQRAIGEQIRQHDARAFAATKENTTLAATRDELLPLLMSGKITVKDAEKRVEEKV